VFVGTLATVPDKFVPCDWEYKFPSPCTVETHSQYWLTLSPLVQVKVTVDDASVDPGAGD
jgi:hypothetical protein